MMENTDIVLLYIKIEANQTLEQQKKGLGNWHYISGQSRAASLQLISRNPLKYRFFLLTICLGDTRATMARTKGHDPVRVS